MIKVCTGWTMPQHEVKVLDPENGQEPGRVSHGMCAECKLALDRELDEEEKRRGDDESLHSGQR